MAGYAIFRGRKRRKNGKENENISSVCVCAVRVKAVSKIRSPPPAKKVEQQKCYYIHSRAPKKDEMRCEAKRRHTEGEYKNEAAMNAKEARKTKKNLSQEEEKVSHAAFEGGVGSGWVK